MLTGVTPAIMIWSRSGGVIWVKDLRLAIICTCSLFVGKHDGQKAPRDRGVCSVVAGILQITVAIIQFPEHPLALVVAQSRVLGRPATTAKLIDTPRIAFTVGVTVIGKGIESLDKFEDTRLIGDRQRPEPQGSNDGAIIGTEIDNLNIMTVNLEAYPTALVIN